MKPALFYFFVVCTGIAIVVWSGSTADWDGAALRGLKTNGAPARSAVTNVVTPVMTAPSILELNVIAFESGIKLGYAAHGAGATKADISFFITCFSNNNVAPIQEWFREKAK